MADGDAEHVGAVCLVKHIGVGLDHDVTRDRRPDHGRRQDFADISVTEQLLDEFDRGSLTGLQSDDGAHALLGRKRGHRSRIVQVAAEWPFAVDGLTGGEGRGDELMVVRGLDGNDDKVDIGSRYQLLVVGEDRGDSECLAGGVCGFRAGRAQRADLVAR